MNTTAPEELVAATLAAEAACLAAEGTREYDAIHGDYLRLASELDGVQRQERRRTDRREQRSPSGLVRIALWVLVLTLLSVIPYSLGVHPAIVIGGTFALYVLGLPVLVGGMPVVRWMFGRTSRRHARTSRH